MGLPLRAVPDEGIEVVRSVRRYQTEKTDRVYWSIQA
jgi:hypothetical protein